MATYRLIHVVRDGSGDTTGLAEYTNSDTVLMPVHSSDPSGSTEGELIYNSTLNTIKIYDGSAWQQVGNSTEAIQDIIGAMVSGNTETNVTVSYDDSDGTLDFVVAGSDTLKDADADTKIQAEESSDEDKLRYDIAGTEVAVQDGGGLAFTTNSGTVRHHQTQAATYTIAASEGQIMAGPVTVTGTITNNGTLVIM
tara:strand:+ start:618 stop:1205 length:588 start_codon:yes stop_codon:yes gene_type:complete